MKRFLIILLLSLPSSVLAAPCSAGFFSEDGQTPCTPCPAGSYQSRAGQTSCLECEPGTFSAVSAADECTDCPPGRGSSDDFTACDVCEPGTYNGTAGEPCKQCDGGSFQVEFGALECNDCDAGEGANETFTGCDACEPGFFNASAGSPCVACEPGYISETEGSLSCEQCPAGAVAPEGSSDCTTCVAGSYGAPGSAECTNCSDGLYQPEDGSTECLTCPENLYAFSETATSCARCRQMRKARLILQTVDTETDLVTVRANTSLGKKQRSSVNPAQNGLSIAVDHLDGARLYTLNLPGNSDSLSPWTRTKRKRKQTYRFSSDEYPEIRSASVIIRNLRRKLKVRTFVRAATELDLNSETSPSMTFVRFGTDGLDPCMSKPHPDRRCRWQAKRLRWRCR